MPRTSPNRSASRARRSSRRSSIAASGPPPAGACLARRRRAGRSAHLLRGHGVGRRLEVDRRRHDVEVDLRRPAGVLDRIDRGRAVRPERRSTSAPARPTSAATSPPATASTSRPTPARPGRTSGSRRGRSARWSSTRRTPTSRSRRCSATPSARTPSAASTARRDGGKTWQQVLKKDADTGASDVAIDPSNPHVLFAGFWQARRLPWELTSGGPGSGLYVSRDGGDTWKQLTGNGLPEGIWGKVGVAVAPSERPARLRADRGREGRAVPLRRRRRDLGAGQPVARAAPARLVLLDAHRRTRATPNDVWFPQVPMLKTIDGGKTFAVREGHRPTATTTTCGSTRRIRSG